MFISYIRPDQATGRLATLYARVAGPGGHVDNILMAHALRPHTLEGHMALYKATLHHSGNALPKALSELVGVYVSLLNGCAYCVDHHAVGLRRLLANEARADAMLTALRFDMTATDAFSERERAALTYAKRLTRECARVQADDVEALRAAGFDDGEILELNQVTAYFAYANRTVLGLGVTTAGDALGLSPSANDEPDNWGHR